MLPHFSSALLRAPTRRTFQPPRTDAPNQDFDWDKLYRLLSEEANSDGNSPMLAEMVVRMFQLLLPPLSHRRINPGSLGMRLIALAWVLSPAYFEGSPSIRTLAKRCGVRFASLASHTGYYSRLLRWRNRGQRHAWNWMRHGTPSHRGRKRKVKVKRNVPTQVTRKIAGSNRDKKSAAKGGETRPKKKAGGVTPSAKSKRKRTGKA